MKKLMCLICSSCTALATMSPVGHFFTQAYMDVLNGKYGVVESASGPGSSLEQTKAIREQITEIIRLYNVTSIVDAPCGDFYWMQFVDLGTCDYIGVDVVERMITTNIQKYGSSKRRFIQIDLLTTPCPYGCMIIARDFLVHLSDEHVWMILDNFKKSGARYVLTTSFPTRHNHTITSGGWRPINLQRAPFNFPAPLYVINEHCSEQNGIYSDKSLMLWDLDEIIIPDRILQIINNRK